MAPRCGFDRPRPSGVANSASAASPRPNRVAAPRISGTCKMLRSTVADAPAAKNSMGAKKFSTSRLISPRRPTMEMPVCQRGQMPPAAISRDRGSSVLSSSCCARSGDMQGNAGGWGTHHNAAVRAPAGIGPPKRNRAFMGGARESPIRRGGNQVREAGMWRLSTRCEMLPDSSQCLMRVASPARRLVPCASSSTMMTSRLATCACITRQWPASLM